MEREKQRYRKIESRRKGAGEILQRNIKKDICCRDREERVRERKEQEQGKSESDKDI